VGSEGNMAQFKAIRNKADKGVTILQCVLQVTQKSRDEHGSGLLIHLELLASKLVKSWRHGRCNIAMCATSDTKARR
jgi:hypothetical protein